MGLAVVCRIGVNKRLDVNKLLLCAGGAFEGVVDDTISPFGYKRGEGIDAGFGEHDWICSRERGQTDPMFEKLNPVDGKITGAGKTYVCNFSTNFHVLVIT